MDELEVEILEEGKLEGASQGDANEVWLEISVLDERREQIVRQQEKMEGMNGLIAAMSGDKGGGKLGQSKGCCSACWRTMAMPYNMAKREVWVMVLNTPSMRKKVEEEGWVIYGKYPAVDVLKDEFDAIMLRESDVGRLYRTFETIDTDKSGEVSMQEMLRFLDLERNRFTETVFTIMDDDRNGSISFKEFVISAWNYCTLTHGTLVMFAFDLYDRDHSGFIDENEMELMLRDVYGDNFRDAAQCDTIVAMLEKMTRDAEREFKKVMIDHHDFADFCRRFPGMLYPAFTLQEKLRNGILGEKFWNEKSLARTYLSDGNYISASQLLALHIQRLGIKEFKSKYKDFEDQSTLNNALGRSGIVKHRASRRGRTKVVELTKEQKGLEPVEDDDTQGDEGRRGAPSPPQEWPRLRQLVVIGRLRLGFGRRARPQARRGRDQAPGTDQEISGNRQQSTGHHARRRGLCERQGGNRQRENPRSRGHQASSSAGGSGAGGRIAGGVVIGG